MRGKRVKSRFFELLAITVVAIVVLMWGNRGAHAILLEFDTELVSLDLSGGPFPIPLASDPQNLLGDSIEGYGFINSEVRITLSSERGGPASFGKAFAFNEFLEPAANGGSGLEPVNPSALDGQTFFVDSFFDVFFDITVTDVDTRPGRDIAGKTDGASVQLLDNGPARLSSFHVVLFDEDAPNFGLVPPPEAGPYIGHFDIEIPLGGDINGNGINDKIKFTVATHAVGDENRTFITLPDGTVIDEFDSAAFLAGAVVDETTDPPFTIGACLVSLNPDGSCSAPNPAVFGGPTTATSLLLNPAAPVPEPGTLALFIFGLAGMGYLRRRR